MSMKTAVEIIFLKENNTQIVLQMKFHALAYHRLSHEVA